MSGRTSIEWRDVPGYPGYSVTSDGRIAGHYGEMRPMRMPSGHLYVIARCDFLARKLFVHRAVLFAFVGPCPDGMEARHLNDIPDDNRIDNLAWGTRVENAADKVRNGGQPRGERMKTHRLTEQQVAEIRARYPIMSTRALATEYGVSHTAIRRAAVGVKWGHVEGAVAPKGRSWRRAAGLRVTRPRPVVHERAADELAATAAVLREDLEEFSVTCECGQQFADAFTYGAHRVKCRGPVARFGRIGAPR